MIPMYVVLLRVIDFINVSFFVFSMLNGFNVMSFKTKEATISLYVIFYVTFLVLSVYVCVVILRVKDRVITSLVTACAKHEPMYKEQLQQLQWKLEQSLQLGDLAEVAFGRLGRRIAECALLLTILSMVVSEMATIRLVFDITTKIANNTEETPGSMNFSQESQHKNFSWSTNSGIYTGIFLPIILLISMLPSYRSLGPISMLGIIGLILSFYHMVSLLYGLSAKYVNYKHMQKIYDVEAYQNASPQMGYAILALSNSAPDNRLGFRLSFVVAIIASFFGICVTTGGLFVCDIEEMSSKKPLLMQFYNTLAPNVINLWYYIAFIFLMNIPLFQLLDRWVSKLLTPAEQDRSLEVLTPLGSSVFEKLHRYNLSPQQTDLRVGSIQMQDVFQDINVKLPLWIFIFLRVIMVVIEWGLSLLCWESKTVILIFFIIELLSTVFVGYVLPVIQHLRIMWFEINIASKIIDFIILFLMLGMTIYSYIRNRRLYSEL